MMTLGEYGEFVLSIDSTPEENEEQPHYNFFEAWPSKWKGFDLGGGGLVDDAWNYTNNPTRFRLMSQTSANSSYVAASITPTGVYDYFSYDGSGNIEAIITLNQAAADKCPQDYPGDINGDCVVDFYDLAWLASDWLKGTE